MSLREYIRKRDFRRTREPAAKAESKRSATLTFVIQKHAATRLHYDFRLEMDGTLKSWAVPKGVPLVRGEKRLAVHVEDHPLDYARFEGNIPKGQYGGGTVIVWDFGTYEPVGDALEGLRKGKLHFTLRGKKLKGEWYLVRLSKQERDKENWLLIKSGQDAKPISERRDNLSALSGRSIKAVKAKTEEPTPRAIKKSKHPKPMFVEPMKARSVETPPPGRWMYEIKFDGYRAIALKHGSAVWLMSRNDKDQTRTFPEAAESVAALDVDTAVIDGEIVALDEEGKPSFQALQRIGDASHRPPILYYVFDLLSLNGKDLRGVPLRERKAMLEEMVGKGRGAIRFSASLGTDASVLLPKVRGVGLEGLIGKRENSVYESGRRSGAWIKLKCVFEQEFVIGGYTAPGGTRKHFGAILIGYHANGALQFAGKVGSGFTGTSLRELHNRFRRIEQKECPFANLPRELRRSHWIKPAIVCEIRFTEWTLDGRLRHPVYLGNRPDKSASEVVREKFVKEAA